MEYEEFIEYMEKLWIYLPYMLYAYIFLTLLPKSFKKIKNIADADYETNRYKYHRCFGPEICCHTLAIDDVVRPAVKVTKTRKTVTRNHARNFVATNNSCHSSTSSELSSYSGRRPVQTYTHVNQIARMFETGGVASYNNADKSSAKKINRVTPIILPSTKSEYFQASPIKKTKLRPIPKVTQRRSSAEEFAEMLMAENLLSLEDFEILENSNSMDGRKSSESDVNADITTVSSHWHTDNVRGRASHQGTSATPSTASPSASCSPSPSASPRQLSPAPVLLRNHRSSIEDIFAAIANNAEKIEPQFSGTVCPVTSIDDILAQRRLSRPLSAYSISDLLLNEENSRMSTNKT